MPTRVFDFIFRRRTKSIDPVKDFAVRLKGGNADPITREQFLVKVHTMSNKALLLSESAETVAKRAQRQSKFTGGNPRVSQELAIKLAAAETLQAEFETLIRQIVFTDPDANSIIELAREVFAEAIEAIRVMMVSVSEGEADSTAGMER